MLLKVKNMAAPAGPAPSLPPSLLARASNRLKISREEVAGNDESFVSGADSPNASPLKVDLGDEDENDADADRDYARDDGYDDSRDDSDRRYDDEDRSSDRDDYDRDRDYDGRDRDDYDDRYRDRDRGYDSRDEDDYSRRGDRDRDGRRRYDSGVGYEYSEDEDRQSPGPGKAYALEAAQPKSTPIDLKKGNAYAYISNSRIPSITAKSTILNYRPILEPE